MACGGPPGTRLEFRLLGPLEVWKDGRPLRLGGERQRALLALLLVHANEVVSSDRLIDELFGGRASETAANAVQAGVSRLRRLLEDGEAGRVIVTRAPGYVLHVEPEQLDLARFEQLLEEGRRKLSDDDPFAASATLREALALWSGLPLADLGSQEFGERERRRLAELGLAAVMERIDADLALGRGAELVLYLRAKPGKRDELLRTLDRLAVLAAKRRQPGFLAAEIQLPFEDEERLLVWSSWASREHYERWLGSPAPITEPGSARPSREGTLTNRRECSMRRSRPAPSQAGRLAPHGVAGHTPSDSRRPRPRRPRTSLTRAPAKFGPAG